MVISLIIDQMTYFEQMYIKLFNNYVDRCYEKGGNYSVLLRYFLIREHFLPFLSLVILFLVFPSSCIILVVKGSHPISILNVILFSSLLAYI